MPALIRKFETKPIRVWHEYSENEPDDYFGSSFAAAIDFDRALRFAGYDLNGRCFAGEGHGSRYHNVEAFKLAFEFLWKDFERQPITAPRNSVRFDAIFPKGSAWSKVDGAPSLKSGKRASCAGVGGEYVAEGKNIYFERAGERELAASFEREISVIRTSSDGWRLYVGGADMPCIYAMNIMSDGKLCGRYLHAAIHRYTDFGYAGVTDMCVGEHDRIYAATELGVQCVRPFGLIDAIAPLPDGTAPVRLALDSSADEKRLFAVTEGGVYAREIREVEGELCANEPKPNSYYD